MDNLLGPVIDSSRYVTHKNGPRPAGKPDECFYCHRPLGGQHEEDCVCVLRRVRIRLTVEYEVEEPAHWTIENIMFHRHESSWCASNAIDELEARFGDESNTCLCAAGATFEVVEWRDREESRHRDE